VGGVIVLVAAWLAAADPTPAQIDACRADALSLCAQHLGSRDGMRACMIAHRSQLSQRCKDAFTK